MIVSEAEESVSMEKAHRAVKGVAGQLAKTLPFLRLVSPKVSSKKAVPTPPAGFKGSKKQPPRGYLVSTTIWLKIVLFFRGCVCQILQRALG